MSIENLIDNRIINEQHFRIIRAQKNVDAWNRSVEHAEKERTIACDYLAKCENIDTIMENIVEASPRDLTPTEYEEIQEEVEIRLRIF